MSPQRAKSRLSLSGYVRWKLWVPGDDESIEEGFENNLITQYGDQYYGERASEIGSHALVTGMQLGTSVTSPSKTGAGAAIVSYITGSAIALDGGFPSSALDGAARVISYETTWAPGIATNGAITEAALINQSVATDSGAPSSNTISRVGFGPINKNILQALTVSWDHFLQGV